MEEHCATNTEINVRIILSRLYESSIEDQNIVVEDNQNHGHHENQLNHGSDNGQEYYPDTVEVDSSNLSVITIVRLNSPELDREEEDHPYMVIVVGSPDRVRDYSRNINWLVAQLVELPAFNRKDVRSNRTGSTTEI